jgi:hypothetical protein
MTTAKPVYTFLEMEAALCVWEAMLEASDAHFRAYWEKVGTCELRSTVPVIGAWCVEVEKHLDRDLLNDKPYDWEIIPAMVRTIDWSGNSPRLLDPKAAAALVMGELA